MQWRDSNRRVRSVLVRILVVEAPADRLKIVRRLADEGQIVLAGGSDDEFV